LLPLESGPFGAVEDRVEEHCEREPPSIVLAVEVGQIEALRHHSGHWQRG